MNIRKFTQGHIKKSFDGHFIVNKLFRNDK